MIALEGSSGFDFGKGTLEQRKINMETIQLKLDLALQFDPGNSIALLSSVRFLCNIANLEKNQNTKKQILSKATRYAKKLEAIEKGSGAFYLACICSLNNEEEQCKLWLELAEKTGNLPTYAEAVGFGKVSTGPFTLKDSCLAQMKRKKWFKSIKFNEADVSPFDIRPHYLRWRYRLWDD